MPPDIYSELWRQWFREHGPRLLLYARQQTRTEADAQDLVQEAILAEWRQAGGAPPAHAGALFQRIRLRAIDLGRSLDRRIAREAAAHSEPATWFEPDIEDRERAAELQQALAALPEDQREVVTLKIWGELTFEQIGDVLAISPNTAASRYRYGLAALRKQLQRVT